MTDVQCHCLLDQLRDREELSMERLEWFCPVCGEHNYGFICEYEGKQCKNCKTKIYIKNNNPIASYYR